MKKLFVIISTLLILASVSYVYAKSTPKELAAAVKRETSKYASIYSKPRVKQMCEEWPGCQEWVANRAAQQPGSFHVIDAEIEHRITHFEKNETLWKHIFYLQTVEGSKAKAYRFERIKIDRDNSHTDTLKYIKESRGYIYLIPDEIKKFPEHPIKEHPSEHARYHVSTTSNDSLAKCLKWDKCKELLKEKMASISKAVEEQYIHNYDENGNALWARSLYVQLYYYSGGSASLAFYTEQKKVGGAYIHHNPHKINQCPYHPDFIF